MDTKFVEVGHGPSGGNWGKFMIARYTANELLEPTQFPGCEGQRIVSLRGSGRHHIWVMDLATGEGARFPVDLGGHPGATARKHLDDHQIWVCPLFEPFIGWLYDFSSANPNTWWDELPRTIEIPEAGFAFAGFRRGEGPTTVITTPENAGVVWHWQGAPTLTADGMWQLRFHHTTPAPGPDEAREDTGPGWYLYGPTAPNGLFMGHSHTECQITASDHIVAHRIAQTAAAMA